jgi:hypothetical protein
MELAVLSGLFTIDVSSKRRPRKQRHASTETKPRGACGGHSGEIR